MLSDNIEMTKAEFVRRKREMSHWVKTADTLYKCRDETELLKMLKAELLGLNRYYIINRIHSRYNAIRKIREKEELRQWRLKHSKQENQNE